MAEILSLHNPEHIDEEVAITREGIDMAFQHIVITDPYGDDELKCLFFANGDDSVVDVFTQDQPHSAALGMRQEQLYLWSATINRCGESVDIVLRHLRQHPDRFDVHRQKSIHDLKHFADHVVGFAHSKITGKWYAFSPNNAFNTGVDLPEYRSRQIQRLTSIICGETYEEVLGILTEIEGGSWPDSLES